MSTTHITTTQRAIAYVLLVSQLLTSCGCNETILPSKKQEEKTQQEHNQLKVETAEPHELPIMSHVSTLVQGNLDEENTQRVQPKPFQLDSEKNKLEVPLVSKGNTPTPLELTTDKRHQVVKQIHQPISLKLPSRTQRSPRLTDSSHPSTYLTNRRGYMQDTEKDQRMEGLKLVQPLTDQGQQELHTSILQTLQNPIWKRHFLGQLTDPQLLSNIHLQPIPIQGGYQLARVQENFQPLVPVLSLQMRKGLHINLVQDIGYWWGILEESRPGFRHNFVLPVLYPQSCCIKQLGPYNQHTVEGLLYTPQEGQQQLIHIFSSSKTFKNGFVYTGQKMGLLGGVMVETIGLCVIIGLSAWSFVLEPYIRFTAGCCRQSRFARERAKLLTKVEKFISATIEEEDKIQEGRKNCTNSITSSEEGYKLLGECLKNLDKYKSQTDDSINRLKGFRESKYASREDKDKIDGYIKNKEKVIDSIKEEREKLIKTAEKQAEAAFKKAQERWDKVTQASIKQLDEVLDGISAGKISVDPQYAIEKIKNNIQECEKFKKDVTLFPGIVQKVYNQIAKEDATLKKASIMAQIIRDVVQSQPEDIPKNAARIQKIVKSNDPLELKNEAVSAIKREDCSMLEYLISIKKISLQEPCDNLGNTLLHKAVEANQPEIVKLLLSYGADKFAINRRKKTPWDLAANKPEMMEIFKKSK